MGLFSKFNANEYNDKLEKILEQKKFSSETKNLLLSMLYKIENSFADYKKVKALEITKEQFIERILYIIENECDIIKAVTPNTGESFELERKKVCCLTDIKKGKILVYANEENLLYALCTLDLEYEKYKYNKDKEHIVEPEQSYINNAIEECIIKGMSINTSEVVRDFNGWSWNIEIKHIENIVYNLIYQNLQLLLGEDIAKIIINPQWKIKENIEKEENFKVAEEEKPEEEKIKEYDYSAILEKLFEKRYIKERYTSILNKIKVILLAYKGIENADIREKIKNIFEKQTQELKLMEDKPAFLNEVTKKKKALNQKIKNIDKILNSRELIETEYEKRNSKLKNENKIFSISHLATMLDRERENILLDIKELNKVIEPLEYIKAIGKKEEEIKFYSDVVNCLNRNEFEDMLKELQKECLKCMLVQIDHFETKQEFIDMIYKFRYYCLLPINEIQTIKDIPELQPNIEEVINSLIDSSIDKQAIENISNSISLCYNTLKYIFYTKIIDLEQIFIKIIKEKEELTSDKQEKIYYISICIFDSKEEEEKHSVVVNNLNSLNIKLNKKIALFL